MKKILLAMLIVMILIAGVFVLTGCEMGKKDEQNNQENGSFQETKSEELETKILTLELDDEEKIEVEFDYPKSDEIELEEDSKKEYFAKLTNRNKNYVLELYLSDEVESTFLETQKYDKEAHEGYTAEKFGENDGYYYRFGEREIDGIVLIDTLRDNDYKFVSFVLSAYEGYDENGDYVDPLSLLKLDEVKNVLDSFGFRYVKTGEEAE